VACLLKARIVKPTEMTVARERLCKHHIRVATLMYATIEELLEAVFSMQSAPTATSSNYRVTAKEAFSVESALKQYKESRLEL
jgi:uncharacterized protein YpbB